MTQILTLSQIMDFMEKLEVTPAHLCAVAGITSDIFTRFKRNPDLNVTIETLLKLRVALEEIAQRRAKASSHVLYCLDQARSGGVYASH